MRDRESLTSSLHPPHVSHPWLPVCTESAPTTLGKVVGRLEGSQDRWESLGERMDPVSPTVNIISGIALPLFVLLKTLDNYRPTD